MAKKVETPPDKSDEWPSMKNYKKVHDATRGITFKVERGDVVGSVVRCTTLCAGARAILRQTGAAKVWVKRSITIIKYADGRMVRYHNANKLKDGIGKYDYTAGLFPEGEYRLSPIPPSQTLKGMREKNKDRSTLPYKTERRKKPVLDLR